MRFNLSFRFQSTAQATLKIQRSTSQYAAVQLIRLYALLLVAPRRSGVFQKLLNFFRHALDSYQEISLNDIHPAGSAMLSKQSVSSLSILQVLLAVADMVCLAGSWLIDSERRRFR